VKLGNVEEGLEFFQDHAKQIAEMLVRALLKAESEPLKMNVLGNLQSLSESHHIVAALKSFSKSEETLNALSATDIYTALKTVILSTDEPTAVCLLLTFH
jgi:phosphoheptose isomerase